MRVPSDILVQLGQVGTLILGSLGVWVAMFNQRRQLNAQMFIEMSRRFQDLLRMFPTQAWLAEQKPVRATAAAEPGDNRLHFVLHSAHRRRLSPAAKSIYFKAALVRLGARNQAHFGRSCLPTRVEDGGGRILSQWELPEIP